MSADDKWSDDDTWDQVADGPLSPGQLAELLAACEQRPELWKRCALALLEEQALRHELQAMARDQSAYRTTRPLTPAAKAALPCPAPEDQGSRVTKATPSPLPRNSFWNSLALAASLLIVFGIGWQSSQRFGYAFQRTIDQPSADLNASGQVAQSDRRLAAPNTAQAMEQAEVDGLARPSYEPPFGLARNGYVADSGTIDQDLIDQANAEALAATMQSDWNEKLDPEYQQLRQAGYEVEAQKGLMPFWLYDGSSAVIPYQQIIVRPKSTSRNY